MEEETVRKEKKNNYYIAYLYICKRFNFAIASNRKK